MTVYVGIDPGLGCTGVCVMRSDKVVDGCAAFLGSTEGTLEGRVYDLAVRAFYYGYGLTDTGERKVLAIEENVAASHGNVSSGSEQREVIAAIKMLATQHHWEIVKVYPVTAKKALTGSGRAEKPDMVASAQRLYGVPSGEYVPAVKGKRRESGQGVQAAKMEAIADAIGVALAAMNKEAK